MLKTIVASISTLGAIVVFNYVAFTKYQPTNREIFLWVVLLFIWYVGSQIKPDPKV